MASRDYSFLDIAVLDDVRARFAAGDALAVLSTDLEEVVWANGEGAALFGYRDIEEIMGAEARLPLAARRQIMAAPGYPALGRDRAIAVRLASGMTSRMVGFLASRIELPDGEAAILLAVPAVNGASRSSREIAERAIAGFSEAGHFVALVDGTGGITAASEGFLDLGIPASTLAGLAGDVINAPDRLVKRLVATGTARLPAGMARLVDQPPLSLLVVVNEDVAAVHEEVPANAPEAALRDGGYDEPPMKPAAEAPAIRKETPPENGRPAPIQPGSAGKGEDDHWYFSAGEEKAAPPSPPRSETPAPAQASGEQASTTADAGRPTPPVERGTTPVRFAWRTDAQGRFSAISDEFANAVGAAAADVIGRKFGDVATMLGFDPDREITGLLERRDTWSGRSVLWPVAGTDLRIPVDLAALPAYGRSRDFEGFRGFGVARPGDAVTDPEGIGLTLTPDYRPPATPPAREAAAGGAGRQTPSTPTRRSEADGGKRRDPFAGEVPALAIVAKPERRQSDKVIRLAEHRVPSANDKGLTPVERNAFREIGDRLKRESGNGAPRAPEAPRTHGGAELTDKTEVPGAENARDTTAGTASGEIAAADRGVGSHPAARDDAETAAPATEPALESERQDPPPVDEPAAETTIDDATEGTADRPPLDAAVGETKAEADSETPATDAEAMPPRPDESPLAAAASRESDAASPEQELDPAAATAATAEHARPGLDTSILDKLPVPVLIHSGDVLHYANRDFLEFTAYASVEELAERGGLGELFGDPYRDEGDGDRTDRKLRLRRGDGLELPVEALLQSVPWKGGKALLLALRKIGRMPVRTPVPGLSAEHRNELEARIAELSTIIDTATDGVVLIANDGAIRSISRPAEALFGVDSAEVAGKPFTALFAMESQRAARDYLNGLSENGVASVLNDGREVIGREAQGRFIPLFMTIGKLPNLGGYCAVVRDITQWKRAEEELTQSRAQAERASSQKTDFLARVSHEIRTPLNAIIGFSELMMDEKFGPIGNDRYRDYMRDINRSGNHVLDLVNDLLDISKIEAGQQDMAYEAVSLNDTLAETVAMMQPQANRERVIIRSSFASRLPEVVADLRSVRQIALNLLSNAVRYTHAGGQVIVSTSYEASGDVAMRVRDTGIGMTPAEIEQALKPFKQVNALKRPRGDGTGLGLPLTKAMVEANRAKFTISSTPGEGTLVEIVFPSTRVLAD
ncbi:ATP-binding protein [Mesorhizobium sp. L-8-3]|uniref:ATP-binding protein n=1 Tax=Mesorhizobium sp. L-8-3 TaxID=2744522 RepID=UPI0019275808|nr:ATP-binding protein [Mesorhizobium sp. L-8-3]BCH26634.1 ATPase [Mesorhizobium sp. L-8-3]